MLVVAGFLYFILGFIVVKIELEIQEFRWTSFGRGEICVKIDFNCKAKRVSSDFNPETKWLLGWWLFRKKMWYALYMFKSFLFFRITIRQVDVYHSFKLQIYTTCKLENWEIFVGFRL